MAEDLLLVSIYTVALVIHGAVAGRTAWVKGSGVRCAFEPRLESCASCCRAFVARTKSLFARRLRSTEATMEAGIVAACVADAMHSQRERLMRDGCRVLSNMMLGCLWFMFYNCVTGNRWMTLPQSVWFVCFHLLVLYMQHTPHTHSLGTLRSFFGASVVGTGLVLVFGPRDIVVLLYTNGAITPARFIFGLFMMDAGFVCLANVVCSAMFCAAVYRSDFEEADVDPLSFRHFLARELVFLIANFCCAFAYQQMTAKASRLAIEAKASKSEQYAAVKVLSRMCDAVVQLDDRLRVADKETKMAALLLHGPGRVLTGSDFLQYLQYEHQRQTFREWLKAPRDTLDENSGFKAKLRDSTGHAITVDMFHVAFEKVPGVLNHFIGIRERTADCQKAGSNAVPSNGASDEASSGIPEEVLDIREVDGHPVFKFDSSSFRVIGCSVGFSIGAHGPLKTGICLAERLKKCDTNTNFFRTYVTTASALITRARDDPDPVTTDWNATMMFTPKASQEQWELNVRIALRSTWMSSADRFDTTKAPYVEATVVVLESVAQGIRSSVSRHSSSSSESSARPVESGRIETLRTRRNGRR